ncbi:MAG TPA: twin-arginine translocase subunit TatC [Acidobacteriota bacterium]|nr:twin-arginine translocase subunit TatC [Acidobacteriota bacterium]
MSKPIPRGSASDSSGEEESSVEDQIDSISQPVDQERASTRDSAPPPPRRASSASSSGEGGEEDEEGEEELGGRMSFLEHLDELRKRIIFSFLAVMIAFGACFVFREQIFDFLQQPITRVLIDRGMEPKLNFIKPTDAFTIYLKVCVVAGTFLAAPFLVWQVWLFIAPGLYRREKAFAIPFLLSATTLFLAGGALAYYLILPAGLHFLVNEMGAKFNPILTAIDFFNFELIIILGMGVVFQMPIIVAFLSIFGMVTPGFLFRNFRYAFLIITIVAAVASPTPDALNLFFWVAPMVLLYVLSIGVSWIFQRRRKKKLAEALGED